MIDSNCLLPTSCRAQRGIIVQQPEIPRWARHDVCAVTIYRWFVMLVALWVGCPAFAEMDNSQMTVWVNEAIVTSYTYNYSNVLARQKDIARYFTAQGWINYHKALTASKLLDVVKKNKYTVSAVATLPPSIKKVGSAQWESTMPLLVLYQNKSQKQTQVLEVVLSFMEVPSGQGVRGLAVTSIRAKKSTPPCQCINQ